VSKAQLRERDLSPGLDAKRLTLWFSCDETIAHKYWVAFDESSLIIFDYSSILQSNCAWLVI
jgi:hypothetical protein